MEGTAGGNPMKKFSLKKTLKYEITIKFLEGVVKQIEAQLYFIFRLID